MAKKYLNKDQLKSFKFQSQIWISLAVVMLVVLSLEINKHGLNSPLIFWYSITIGTSWWSWTMYVINALINQRIAETELLDDLKNDVKLIRTDIIDK
jgi:hypothetical protein